MPEPVVAPVEPVVVPSVVIVPPVETVPKTKEEWQALAKENPTRWMDLTQQNMDRVVRESRETKEALDRERAEKQNLLQEVNRYKAPVPVVPEGQKYTINNPPKTQVEWDALFIESPKYASDLSSAINTRISSNNADFQRAFSNAAREVQAEHPDMYVLEVDSTGQLLRDGQGKPLLKKNQQGLPILDLTSEKGKLWEQIYNESYRPDGTNPLDTLPNTPTLLMAELERRLVKKGTAVVRAQEIKQNHVAPVGIAPPTPSAKVKFASDGEKEHAEKAVARGTFKNLEEYCQLRDKGERGFYESNRRPDFTKK